MDTGVLNGTEFVEYVVSLDGDLDSLETELTFTNSDEDGTWAGDVAVQIAAPVASALRLVHSMWRPASTAFRKISAEWNVADSGEYSFTFALCGQSSGLSDWNIRLTHGYETGSDDQWSGTLTFSVLTDEAPCPADLSGDGVVGFSDLSIILSNWLTSDGGDVNGDGQTNFSDLSLVLSARAQNAEQLTPRISEPLRVALGRLGRFSKDHLDLTGKWPIWCHDVSSQFGRNHVQHEPDSVCLLLDRFGHTATVSATESVARQWNELLLGSTRNDSLGQQCMLESLHTSAAMWDAWSCFEDGPAPWLSTSQSADWRSGILPETAISHARLASCPIGRPSPGADTMLPAYENKMISLGLDPANDTLIGNSPAAVGNRIAQAYIQFGLADSSNEVNDYENLYEPINPALYPEDPGNLVTTDGSLWALKNSSTNPVTLLRAVYVLVSEWGAVVPFSLQTDRAASTNAMVRIGPCIWTPDLRLF